MTGDYQQLLQCDEWKQRSQEVMHRANHACSECGRNRSQGIVLEVHHRYYRLGLMPWDYPDSALVCLCSEHHEKAHRNKIPVFDEKGRPFAKQVSCGKCGGSGYIPPYHYVSNGICFRCQGTGIDPEKIVIGFTQAQMDKREV